MSHSSRSLRNKLPKKLRGKAKIGSASPDGEETGVTSPLDGVYRKEHPGVPPSAASYIMGVTREDLEKIHSKERVPESRETPRYLVSMKNDPDRVSVFEENPVIRKLKFASRFSLHFMHLLFHGRAFGKKESDQKKLRKLNNSAQITAEEKAQALLPPKEKPPLLERD